MAKLNSRCVMRRLGRLALLALATCLIQQTLWAAEGDAAQDSISEPHVAGEVIVGFKPRASASDKATLHAELNATVLRTIPELRVEIVRSKGAAATSALIATYIRSPLVEYAEPNYLHHLTSAPNDPKYPQQWALNNTGQVGACNAMGTTDADIDALEAWGLQTGSSSVIVAVIDSGVDYTHPDLSGNIWSNSGETNCTNGIDDDGNGYIDDCRGWDFVNSDNAPLDDYGHGTHVAGIIGAVGNNSAGTTGVAWSVKLMPLKVFGTGGTGSTGDIANAILYARDKGAKIINYSAGGGSSTTINNAISASPLVLFVSAAASQAGGGQDEDSHHWYPCDAAIASIVCVTDTDEKDAIDPLSNWGLTTVDLSAPGVNIFSTAIASASVCNANYDSTNRLACCTGTSMAVPHVAGTAALMISQRSAITVAQVKTALINTVDLKPGVHAGDNVAGGRLNAYQAVRSAGDTTPPTAPSGLDAHYDSIHGGVTLSWGASTDTIGVHHYEILRTTKVTISYSVVGISTSLTFLDTSAVTSPVTAYLYKVHAVDAAGNVSSDSNRDVATAIAFTDDPVTTASTIRGVHVTELRAAVNAVRFAANLGTFSWTDDPIVSGSTQVKATHIAELRAALTAARVALGYSDPAFTDATITAGVTMVKAVHITELRDRTK